MFFRLRGAILEALNTKVDHRGNYLRVSRALEEAGYEGFAGFEPFPSRDPLAVARELAIPFQPPQARGADPLSG